MNSGVCRRATATPRFQDGVVGFSFAGRVVSAANAEPAEAVPTTAIDQR